MAFVYYKYLTDYGNTIVAVSDTPFTPGPGEGQIFTDFEIPVVQPLYLYAENSGNVIVNSDSQINDYLAFIGEAPFETMFTGYTASTDTRISLIEANVVYLSGQTQLRLKTSDFNIYSGATLTNIQSRLLTSSFNIYSGATQTQINGKLGKTEFNAYSAETYQLIQSSQAGLDPKESVFLATVAPLAGAVYVPTGGTAGTGSFTSAPTSVDGRVLSNGKRVLVKNQTDAKQNGIYVVVSSGNWKRAADQDGSSALNNISAGNYTFVETGTTNIGSGWSVIGTGIITINVDNVVWTQFNAATGYVAGTGIMITGNTIAFNGASVAGNALTWSGTQLNVNPTGGTLGTKFNTKLDVSAFNTYSADTLTNINSRVLKTVFSTYTGTTAPATFLSIANFNAYSASTLSNINSKLSIANFNVYSATTLVNINSRLLISSFNVYSGATLTNINSRLLTSAFNTYSGVTLTNINSRLLTSAFNTYSGQTAVILNTKVDTANNGLTKVGRNVRLGGALSGTTNIGLGTFNLVFTGASGTVRYGSDVSASYNVRSFIDKGFYTGNTLHTRDQILVYASGVTDINVTTAASIPLNRLIRNSSAVFTYTGGTAIKILVAGTYDVSYLVNGANTTNNAHSIAAALYKNGTIITETTTTCSTPNTTASAGSLSLPPTQITFAANDIVHLRGFRLIAGGGLFNTTANAVFLSIVKKH